MKKILSIFFTLLGIGLAYSQTDNVGPGRALRFDGVDDLVDLGNIYDEVALPVTISVWLYFDPTEEKITFPIIDSQENSSSYNGFTFVVSTNSHIAVTYGDGHGGNNPAFRRSKRIFLHSLTGRWFHLAVIMRGATDMDIYLNGINLGGEYEGSSGFPMNSNSPSEVAKIGHHFSNGIHYRYKGIMDELRIWNRSLSQQEIRESMCRRLQGNENGLIGYWNFDEISGNTLFDKSPNGFHGELKGGPLRVFSGAPIGDESVFTYSNNWSGLAVSKENGSDKVELSNVSLTEGVHLYEVMHLPSQSIGLDGSQVSAPYFGVFATSTNAAYKYNLNYTISGETVCKYYTREDNSVSNWSEKELPAANEVKRIEIIKSVNSDETAVLDLGEDLVLCDAELKTLTSSIESSDVEFKWSTGEVSPSITVIESGLYSLTVTQGCLVSKDTVSVVFRSPPKSFSLGEDQVLCELKPRTLDPKHPVEGFTFIWQDDSSNPTLEAKDYGLYWLEIRNECGVYADSVRFTHADIGDYKIPNVITANGDPVNQHFTLHPILMGSSLTVFNRWGKLVFASASYHNEWDGGDLPAGVYFYTLSGNCLNGTKGVISIKR